MPVQGMERRVITSLTNDTVKYIEKLKKKTSFRREEGCFVVEGIRMIREVPENRRILLFLTEDASRQYPELAFWCERTELVSPQVLQKLSDTETPQGMLAVVSMSDRVPAAEPARDAEPTGTAEPARDAEPTCTAEPARDAEPTGTAEPARDAEPTRTAEPARDAEPTCTAEPLYLVLDGLQDPGNVGTLIRTAEAVGATEVLMSRNTADPYSPKVVRSTMGTIFRVSVRITEDLPSAIEELKKKGVVIFGTHLSGTDFYEADLTGPAAFLIGNEGNGLSEAVAATADRLLKIPMEGKVESLNAAVSGSVVAYEAYRQRVRGRI